LHGRPLLEHAVDAMLAVPALDPVVVVLGHAAEEILRTAELDAAQVVICRDWALGQSASLRCGVAAVPGAGAVAVTLGDQPFITPQVIAGALDRLDGGCDAVRTVYDGAPGHPVVLGRRVLDALGELDGDQGARELLSRFRVRRWEAGHLCSTVDVDTQEELSRL
jgi:molybdenum cofactor cytidylyltransferase